MAIVAPLLEHKDLEVSKTYGTHHYSLLQRVYLQIDDDSFCRQIEELLLEKKVDVNYKNSLGHTAIFYAAALGRSASVQNLVENHSADAKVLDNAQNCLLHFVFDLPTARVVMRHCSEFINHKNCEGNTPLHIAASFSSFEVVNFFLSNGANSEISNNNGDTPMECVFVDRQAVHFAFYEEDSFYKESNGIFLPKVGKFSVLDEKPTSTEGK